MASLATTKNLLGSALWTTPWLLWRYFLMRQIKESPNDGLKQLPIPPLILSSWVLWGRYTRGPEVTVGDKGLDFLEERIDPQSAMLLASHLSVNCQLVHSSRSKIPYKKRDVKGGQWWDAKNCHDSQTTGNLLLVLSVETGSKMVKVHLSCIILPSQTGRKNPTSHNHHTALLQ